MTWLREYLFRLVTGAFLISILMAVLKDGRLKQATRLCCGCFLAILVLQPLLRGEIPSWEDCLKYFTGTKEFDTALAKEKNEQVLSELVQAQTEAYIHTEIEKVGAELSARVTVRYDPDLGCPVPDGVRFSGTCSPEQKAALTEVISQALDIPMERLEWDTS